MANVGSHIVHLRGFPTPQPEYFAYEADPNKGITIHRSTYEANRNGEPNSDTALSETINRVLADRNEALELYYHNYTDGIQRSDIQIQLRIIVR